MSSSSSSSSGKRRPAATAGSSSSSSSTAAAAAGAAAGATASEGLPEFDVCVCGGTLGVFVALMLANKGWRVAVVERGALRGRRQEWNISKKELQELVEVRGGGRRGGGGCG
jgi:hypothetical protein